MKLLKLRERSGFSTFRMRLLYRLIYPFFHCRCVLPTAVSDSDEPVVFVANHYNVFGPVSFMASMPIDSAAWVNEELITPATTETAMIPGVQKMLPFVRTGRIRRICKRFSRTVCNVILRFGPIPVSRKEPAKLAATLRKSVEALEKGRSLTIFPETGIPEYSLTSVSPFFAGFAVLGRLYWRKTGKPLRFYPTYIDEQHHEISFGAPVTYHPENDNVTAECSRISDELNQSIAAMAEKFHGVAVEQRTPVRKSLPVCCNILRFLLMIPLTAVLFAGRMPATLVLYLITQGLRITVNLIRGTLPATNHGIFLLSHGITLLTDTLMLFRLASFDRKLFLLAALLAAGLFLFVMVNLHTYFRANRCAGTNYFDTLSANLICILAVTRLLDFRLKPLAETLFRLIITGFLACAMAFNLVFNLRILQKDV